MGSWSWEGIVVIILLFFALLGFILAQIQVTNPYTGIEQSILGTIIGNLF